MIASSPTDVAPVLDAIAQRAAALLRDSYDVLIYLHEGDGLRLVAGARSGGEPWGRERDVPAPAAEPTLGSRLPLAGTVCGRAVTDCTTLHIRDLAHASADEYPVAVRGQRENRLRTVLAVPMVRGDLGIGVIFLRRLEVVPFTDQQITLLETFAAQAVIAIENARLFSDLRESNRQVTEALEQQTATAEVLRVIASSPTDLSMVLGTIAAAAPRLCETIGCFGMPGRVTATSTGSSLRPVIASVTSLGSRRLWSRERRQPAILESRAIHVADLAASLDEFPETRPFQERYGHRTVLVTPLMRRGEAIGAISLPRTDVRPFTTARSTCSETFADQAVIAIENARLFEELEQRNAELTEALEQQTATAEVLRVIASSPTDLEHGPSTPSSSSAARLCERGRRHRRSCVSGDDDRARGQRSRRSGRLVRTATSMPPVDASIAGRAHPRAADDPRAATWPSRSADAELPDDASHRRAGRRRRWRRPAAARGRGRSARSSSAGSRSRPFTEQQIALLETFADQAVIAIENARLFEELEQRNRRGDRGAGAADRDRRGAARHRLLADRPAGGCSRRSPRARCAPLRRPTCGAFDRVDGDDYVVAASAGHGRRDDDADWRIPPRRGSDRSPRLRRSTRRRTIHVDDVQCPRRCGPAIARSRVQASASARSCSRPAPARGRADRRHRRSAATRSGRSPSSRSRCWRRSRTRPSSPSRTPACSRSCRSARRSSRARSRSSGRSPRSARPSARRSTSRKC